jgi:hypothetical protein
MFIRGFAALLRTCILYVEIMLDKIIVYYNQCDIHHEGVREDLDLTIACLYFLKFISCFCLFWETLKLKLTDFMFA